MEENLNASPEANDVVLLNCEVLEEEDLPQIEEVKEKPKPKSAGGRKGQSRERMMELHKIRSEKAKERRELKEKADEVLRIKKEKIEFEYQQAQKLKEAIEAKKANVNAKQMRSSEPNNTDASRGMLRNSEALAIKELYKTASRDILKEKYLEEAKRRVMADLFS